MILGDWKWVIGKGIGVVGKDEGKIVIESPKDGISNNIKNL